METEQELQNTGPDPVKNINRIYIAKDCLALPYTKEILVRIDTSSVEVLPADQLAKKALNADR